LDNKTTWNQQRIEKRSDRGEQRSERGEWRNEIKQENGRQNERRRIQRRG
jgi:hypothetical protein